MSSDVAPGIRAIATIRGRVDEVLGERLRGWRQELAELDPSAADLVDEIERLIAAGGKRLRPAFLYWGYRAAGGVDGRRWCAPQPPWSCCTHSRSSTTT
jgi:hypothetical protein